MKRIISKVAFKMNVKYSRVWMRITGLDKYEYRERSILHRVFVAMY